MWCVGNVGMNLDLLKKEGRSNEKKIEYKKREIKLFTEAKVSAGPARGNLSTVFIDDSHCFNS